MLDGAFMQETSNIIEDTFSAYNICKGRIFEKINKAMFVTPGQAIFKYCFLAKSDVQMRIRRKRIPPKFEH